MEAKRDIICNLFQEYFDGNEYKRDIIYDLFLEYFDDNESKRDIICNFFQEYFDGNENQNQKSRNNSDHIDSEEDKIEESTTKKPLPKKRKIAKK